MSKPTVFTRDEVISIFLAAGLGIDPEEVRPLDARAAVYKVKALVEASRNSDGRYDISFEITGR